MAFDSDSDPVADLVVMQRRGANFLKLKLGKDFIRFIFM